MSRQIEFSRKEVVAMIREISEIVVSMDRIGGSAADMPENQWKEAVIDYLTEKDVLNRLADVRHILTSKFENEPLGKDDMSELQRELQDVEHWSYKEYMAKKGLQRGD